MKDSLGNFQAALVLGGSSELASALLSRLTGQRLARAALLGRPGSATQQAAALTDAGVSVTLHDFDALDTTSHDDAVAEAFAAVGDIDIAVVAFGYLGSQERAEADNAEAALIAATNYVGTVTATLSVARHMREQGHGTIVVFSSVAGLRSRRSNFVYGSSKAGADAFAQGLADSLVGTGVNVLIVRPGFVHTRMTDGMDSAPFATTATAVAGDIVRALANGKPVVYSPAVLRHLFIVLRHLPRAVFRRLPG